MSYFISMVLLLLLLVRLNQFLNLCEKECLWSIHLCPCSQLGAAYISATTGAVVTALGLKSLATVIFVVPVNKQMK